MSSQPECRKCGYYVHSGLVVCEECSGILADEMKAISAENARLTAELARIADDYYAEYGMDASSALSEMREALMALLTKDGE